MNFGEKLKQMRRESGLSQETMGSQGFISAPGWIKVENGQRQASEKLIEQFVDWMVEHKHMRSGATKSTKAELLTLKYLSHSSAFVRAMAAVHAQSLPGGAELLVASAREKPQRGRPKKAS